MIYTLQALTILSLTLAVSASTAAGILPRAPAPTWQVSYFLIFLD